ncbi:MAG: hypothetical protein V2A70_10015, partial [Candidatus Omnitrophota bacterium]
MFRILWGMVFLEVMMIVPVCAQPSDAVQAPAVPVYAEASPVEAVLKVDVNDRGNVSLDFRDADIKNVLKVIAFKSGVNIIAGPEVVGVVNIQLKNVPWKRALEVI